MAEWMYAYSLPEDMHPEGCQCGACLGSATADALATCISDAWRKWYARDCRLAEILGVDIETVIAVLPDNSVVPDELWQAALAQARSEGL